ISYGLWQRRFGASREIAGRLIQIDGQAFEIIGVAPRGFFFPHRSVDIWRPIFSWLSATDQLRHVLHFLRVIARLSDRVSIEQASAELDGIAARYKTAHPGEANGNG